MSLYDKLLPWRSKRSGTSLARVCVRNALQMGEQLPYSRVRLIYLIANAVCCFYYLSFLKYERRASRERICTLHWTWDIWRKLQLKSIPLFGGKRSLCKCLASKLSDKNEGAVIERNTFVLGCSSTTFLRELFPVPVGVVAFSGRWCCLSYHSNTKLTRECRICLLYTATLDLWASKMISRK